MKRSSSFRAKTKGFTLVELLIVIVIIGILAAALLPRVIGAPARARDEQRKADINALVAVMEQYNGDVGHYPQGTGTLAASCAGSSTSEQVYSALVTGSYIQEIPTDPDTTHDTMTCTTGTSDGKYYYKPLYPNSTTTTGSATNYVLIAKLERPVETDTDGIYCSSSFTTVSNDYESVINAINGFTACSSSNSNAYYIVVR